MPETLEECIRKSGENREFAREKSYIYRMILEKDKTNGSLEYIAKYTLRKLTTLYCMYSGTNDAIIALNDLRNSLGDAMALIARDPQCSVTHDPEKSELRIQSRGEDFRVRITERHEATPFENQNVAMQRLSPEERISWTANNSRRKDGAKYELADNALGEIEDVTIFNNGEVLGAILVPATPVSQLRRLIEGLKTKKIRIAFSERQKYPYHPTNLRRIVGSENFPEAEKRVTFFPVTADIRTWARDDFLQAVNPLSGKRVLLGFSAEFPDSESKDSPPGFGQEGGDWRAIGPYLFLGRQFSEVIESTAEKEKISSEAAEEKMKREYETLFGREVIHVKKSPAFHLDVFVTFLPTEKGKPTVLVADLSQTTEIMNNLSPAERDRTEKQMLRTEFEPTVDSPESVMSKWNFQNDVFGGLRTYTDDLTGDTEYKDQQGNLDEAADWFREEGYDVVRVPTGLMHASAPGLAPEDLPQKYLIRRTFWQSYNNCLIEAYVDEEGILQKHAYIPSFGLPVETAVIRAFNAQGYKVYPVNGLQNAAASHGALNCLTSEFRKAFDAQSPSPAHLVYTYKNADEKRKEMLHPHLMALVSVLKKQIDDDPRNPELEMALDSLLKELGLKNEMLEILEHLREEKKLSLSGSMLLADKIYASDSGTAEALRRVTKYMRDSFERHGREAAAHYERLAGRMRK